MSTEKEELSVLTGNDLKQLQEQNSARKDQASSVDSIQFDSSISEKEGEDTDASLVVINTLFDHVRITGEPLLIGPNFGDVKSYTHLLRNVLQGKQRGRTVAFGEKPVYVVGGRWGGVIRLKMKRNPPQESTSTNNEDFEAMVEGIDGVKIRGCWYGGSGKKKEEKIRAAESLRNGVYLLRIDCQNGWTLVLQLRAVWEKDEKTNGGVGVKLEVMEFSISKGDDEKQVETVFLTEWTMSVKGTAGSKGMEVPRYWPHGEYESVKVEGEKVVENELNANVGVSYPPEISVGGASKRGTTYQVNTRFQLFDTGAARGNASGGAVFTWHSGAWSRPEAHYEYHVDRNLTKYLLGQGNHVPGAVGIPLNDGHRVGAFFRMPDKSTKTPRFYISLSAKFRKPKKFRSLSGAQTEKNIPKTRFEFSFTIDGKDISSNSLEAHLKGLLKPSTTL